MPHDGKELRISSPTISQIYRDTLIRIDSHIIRSAPEPSSNLVLRNTPIKRLLPPINKVNPYSSSLKESASDDIHVSNDFTVSWKNLSYTITKPWPIKPRTKLVLNNLNGKFKSSHMTAIMGPSGSGKSTLLECICGVRRNGVSGDVRIRGADDVTIGIVPQFDHLLEKLTVKETFVFACKLREATLRTKVDHEEVALKVIKQFKLEPVKETRVLQCSGGQRKRVSIALEVNANPNILILDEPTTGLDSSSCTMVMNVMRELTSNTKQRMAVVAIIHQPSVAVFKHFHHVYILSQDGQCVYEGPSDKLIATMSSVGLNCPSFTSPSDYIIEIAAGDYGQKPIDELIVNHKRNDMTEIVTARTKILRESIKKRSHPLFTHAKILFHRSMLTVYRTPVIIIARIVATFFTSICLVLIFGPKVGRVSGCPIQKLELYTTDFAVLTSKFRDDLILIMENVCLLFMGLMVGLIGSMAPLLLTFPVEMKIFIKEYNNGLYSCASFYFAKVFSDVPLQILTPAIYIGITYHMTGQPESVGRPLALLFMAILFGFTGQSLGESVSAIWCYNVNAVAFAGGIIPLPMILFGGFLVKVSRMPIYLQPLSWLSFMRFPLEGMLISMYGFGRCQYEADRIASKINISSVEQPLWVKYLPQLMSAAKTAKARKYPHLYTTTPPSDEDYDYDAVKPADDVESLISLFGGSVVAEGDVFDVNKSLILSYYGINDNDFYRAIYIMTFYLIALRIVTYFILIIKLNAKR